MLTWLIAAPALAALVVAFLPRERKELYLPVGILLSFVPLALAGVVFFEFQGGEAAFQFAERVAWYQPWGIEWNVGIDGISLGMIVLTTILFPISLAASTAIDHRVKEFVVSVLFLEAGLIGTFLALDLFLFFVFFEAILVPMYFIIGIWGSERRIYAAVKFFIYTAFGSALMFAGIIALAFLHAEQTGAASFAYQDLLGLDLSVVDERLLFAAFGLA
ncbi:MAG: proton-conducting transporter membrane subunit, partial [Acidimicrobiia bacterium]